MENFRTNYFSKAFYNSISLKINKYILLELSRQDRVTDRASNPTQEDGD